LRAVVLGATGGIGRALARRMAARGAEIYLLGRDAHGLAASAKDLEAHGARTPVGYGECDLLRPEMFAEALARADSCLSGFDTVVVSAALFATQERLEADPDLLHRLLAVDFAHTIEFCEEARKRLLARGGGTLCVVSSVAGERARKPVVLYGAAKAGLTRYLEGLDHRFRSRGLRTICVKPGFVRTAMTAGLPAPPFAGDPDLVASTVLAAIERGQPVVYAPKVWGVIAAILRALPRAVLRRTEF
jgi:NAD(P)-dependent dehydrogenase (short-subunit alcohol dehydrogenase family)